MGTQSRRWWRGDDVLLDAIARPTTVHRSEWGGGEGGAGGRWWRGLRARDPWQAALLFFEGGGGDLTPFARVISRIENWEKIGNPEMKFSIFDVIDGIFYSKSRKHV